MRRLLNRAPSPKSLRWRWIIGLGMPLGAPIVGSPILAWLFSQGFGGPVLVLALAGLAAAVASLVVLPIGPLKRFGLGIVYVPAAYVATGALVYAWIMLDRSSVRLENHASTPLTHVEVEFSGVLVAAADIAPGARRTLRGRPRLEGGMDVAFSRAGRPVQIALPVYFTPGMTADCVVAVTDLAVTERCRH